MESANLKLNESIDVPVPPDHMWLLVTEPASIVSCMPGASLTGVNDDGSLSGELVTKFGPTTVRFHGKVILNFDHDHRVGTLEARGGDKTGRTKAAATVSFRLTPADAPGASQVAIDAVIDVSGGLAPFVRTGGLHLTRRMLQDFSTNLGALAAGDEAEKYEGSASTEPGQAAAPVRPPAVPAKPISGFGLLARTFLDIVRAGFRKLLHRDHTVPSTDTGSPTDTGRTTR